jgi:hypothetical protein
LEYHPVGQSSAIEELKREETNETFSDCQQAYGHAAILCWKKLIFETMTSGSYRLLS